MLLKLPSRWIEHLQAQPESGLGYQRVALRLQDGRLIAEAFVFNAEQLEIKEEVEITPDEIVEITVKP